MEPLLQIVHEDPDRLVLHKPAGLVCHPTKGDASSSLIGRVRLHLGPNNRPHLVNRLDRETSGLVLVAKTPAATLELCRLWERRQVRKDYLAIVHGHVTKPRGLIDAPLGRDEASPVAIQDKVRPDGAPARTAFAVLTRFEREAAAFSFVRLRPLTGRKHQLRIHLAYLGHPVVGDKLYGGDPDLYLAFVQDRLTEGQRAQLRLSNQALHAAQLRFLWRGCPQVFTAVPEPEFIAFLPEAGRAAASVAWPALDEKNPRRVRTPGRQVPAPAARTRPVPSPSGAWETPLPAAPAFSSAV